jgi:hypothetical protein
MGGPPNKGSLDRVVQRKGYKHTSTKLHPKINPWSLLCVLIILAGCSTAARPVQTAADTVTINMGSTLGAPTYQASGFIYGLSPDASSPPQNMLSDIKVKYLRVGGAQLGCPNGGWINSFSNYQTRWNTVKAYYTKAQAIGATVIILLHDLWGADLVCTVNTFPGDNGDWTNYTNFMTQVINDAKAAGMTGLNVQWDIWNEPDCCGFFGSRSESQYLEMWKRGFQQIRAAISNAVITGPSFSQQPNGNAFPSYLDYIKANNVIPNVISWHEERGGNDPTSDKSTLDTMLSSLGISISDGYNVNEYGTRSEQDPGHSAWYLARFTRNGMAGLRGNWGMNTGLWAGMGDLVTSNGQPLGQWWIYKRYADITGQLVSVTPGSQVDAVAGTDTNAKKAIIVVGNEGGVTGLVNVVIHNIPSYLQNSRKIYVLVEQMPTGNSYVSAPTVVSNSSMTLSENSLTVTINWSTATDGYAITLTPEKSSGSTK